MAKRDVATKLDGANGAPLHAADLLPIPAVREHPVRMLQALRG